MTRSGTIVARFDLRGLPDAIAPAGHAAPFAACDNRLQATRKIMPLLSPAVGVLGFLLVGFAGCPACAGEKTLQLSGEYGNASQSSPSKDAKQKSSKYRAKKDIMVITGKEPAPDCFIGHWASTVQHREHTDPFMTSSIVGKPEDVPISSELTIMNSEITWKGKPVEGIVNTGEYSVASQSISFTIHEIAYVCEPITETRPVQISIRCMDGSISLQQPATKTIVRKDCKQNPHIKYRETIGVPELGVFAVYSPAISYEFRKK